MSMHIQQRAEKMKAFKGSSRAIVANNEASKIQRYQQWQHSYSIHVCQQSAVLGAAEAYMVDMIQHIRESKYYRHQVKYNTNQLDTNTLEKWHEKFSKGAAMEVLWEIIDSSKSALQKDLTVLFYSVKNEMDREKLPDTQLRAEVYMVNLLIDLSCFMWEFHVQIGPKPEFIPQEQADYLRSQVDEAINEHKHINSPYFDEDYMYWIQEMKPVKLKMQMQNILSGIVGKWHHRTNGNVSKSLAIIMRKITDNDWLNDVSLKGLIDSGMYDEEIRRLNRMDTFRLGAVEVTLDLLDAVRAYIAGKGDGEIHDELLQTNPNLQLMPDHLEKIMAVVKMMRLMDEHPETQEMLNELEQAYDRGGKEEAERVHKARLEKEKRELARGKKPSGKPLTERDALIARLSQNFKVVVKENERTTAREDTKPSQPDNLADKAQENKPILQGNDDSRPARTTDTGHTEGDLPRTTQADTRINVGERILVEVPTNSKKPVTDVNGDIDLTIQPPKARVTRAKWSEEEEAYLIDEWEKGITPDCIARQLHRTEHAVRCRHTLIIHRPVEAKPERLII